MNRLKLLREERGETYEVLSDILGVATLTIYRWENEQREMDNKTLKKVADHYAVTLDYLLARDFDLKDLNVEERKLIISYRNLHPVGKKIINAIIKIFEEHTWT